MAYPAGMSTCTIEMYVEAVGGKYASGEYRVEVERKFGYTGTSWVMQRVTRPWTRLSSGWLRIELPHTNQAGLIADFGGAITAQPAYKTTIRLTNDLQFGDAKYFYLPTSVGTGTVALSGLIDLGGWPNQIVTPAPPPTGGGDVIYVQDPNNPLLAYVTDDGTF